VSQILLHNQLIQAATLILILSLAISGIEFVNVELGASPLKMREGEKYEEHDVISIDGNKDFLLQSVSEGWLGTGAKDDPIQISGYRIRNARHLIRIINTPTAAFFLKEIL